MTRLIVAAPKRPLMAGVHQRFQYRVELPNGTVLTLSEIAQKLKIPYASLAAAVRTRELPIGSYEQEFLEIVSRVRKRMHASKIPATIRCTHCSGTGRMSSEPKPTSGDSSIEATS